MSIALDNNPNSGGFLRRNKMSSFNSSPILDSGDRTVMRMVVNEERENGYLDPCSSSSSSSIGMNSDVDDDEQKNDEEQEVQSKLTNTSFDSAVDALEQALPIRRGISNFYNGKSKSFASLTDAASSSIKEITKSENAYSRKRKNLLAYNLLYDKDQTSWLKSPGIGGGIAKRPTNSSRSTLALAVAMKNCEHPINENG
ncbi:Septation ring formation regulator EzrA [Bienertia sinuspersici]